MTAHLRYLWVGLFTLFTLVSTTVVSAQDIAWAKSLEEAQARAAAENKVVQLHFWATFCPPCRQLESFVFPVPEIAAKMNQNVVAVKIDTQKNPELAKKYAISKIPQDVFLGANGEVLFRRISPTNSQNYGIMLDTAMKIASQTTRQSQMAVEAIASIGQDKSDKDNRSMFLGQQAATAGNARQFASAAQKNVSAQHGVSAQLPAATINSGNTASPTQIATSVDKLAATLKTGMPETQFPQATFAAPKMPTLPNAFANNQQVNRAAPTQPSGTARATIMNPNFNQTATPASQQSTTLPSPSPALTAQVSKPAEQVSASQIASIETSSPKTVQVSAAEPASTGPELGLDGYCPVSLLTQQKWVKGNTDFGRIHRGKLYLFANEAAANQFFANPDALSPALAGFDPVTFATTGKLVEGERKFGVFCETESGLSIVLFSNSTNRDHFKADREKYLEKIQIATANADRK